MSVRARINVIWLVLFAIMAHFGWFIFSYPEDTLAGKVPFSDYYLQIASYFILIFSVLTVDWKRATIFKHIPAHEPCSCSLGSLLVRLTTPNDSDKEKSLIMLFFSAGTLSALASLSSFWAFSNGSPRLLADILSALTLILIVYVRWRSHTCWEKELLT
jgi:membrane protease YdiL (CAAX protease family)